jgi:hypothetical protein
MEYITPVIMPLTNHGMIISDTREGSESKTFEWPGKGTLEVKAAYALNEEGE